MKTILGITVYSIKEIAEMLSVTTVTVHNYVKSGKLDARKIGGAWYVSEETIKAFVSGGGNRDSEQ